VFLLARGTRASTRLDFALQTQAAQWRLPAAIAATGSSMESNTGALAKSMSMMTAIKGASTTKANTDAATWNEL
jgi:hypothetical protein